MVDFNLNTITTRQVRSLLRDPNNRADGALVGSCTAKGIIAADYFVPLPKRIRTYYDMESSKKYAFGRFVGAPRVRKYKEEFLPKKILPDPRYDPIKFDDVGMGSTLGSGITVGMFANTPGNSPTLNHLSQGERKLIAQRFYCHVPMILGFRNNEKFKNHSLSITDGLAKAGTGENLVTGDIRDLQTQGRAVVYEVIDPKGKPNPWKTFELAQYWKDNHVFQGLILHFDGLNPNPGGDPVNENKDYNAEIIVVMPKVDDMYRGKFQRKVRTDINFRTFIKDGLGFFQYK